MHFKQINKNIYYIFFIILFYFFSYCFNLSKNYTFDTIGFLYAIREKIIFQIFHSYHIIFLPIQIFFLKLFNVADKLTYLQIINSIVNICSLIFLYFILNKIIKNKFVSFLIVLLAGSTLWHFKYAVDLEVHSYNGFIDCLVILILLYFKNNFHIFIFLLPAFIIAVLFHQINALLFPTIIFALVYKKIPIKTIIIFLLMLLGILSIIYIFIGFHFLKLNSIKKFYEWITYYQQLGYWGGFTIDTIKDSILGFAYSIVGKGYKKVLIFYFILIFYLAVFLRNFKYFIKNYFYELGIFLFWFSFQSAVVIYWHPLNIENWLSQLAIWIPIAVISKFLFDKYNKILVSGIIIIFFISNYFIIYKNYIKPFSSAQNNMNLIITKKIHTIVPDNANLIILGEGEYANLNIYLLYFCPRLNLYSIDKILVDNKSDFSKMCNILENLKSGFLLSDVMEKTTGEDNPLLLKHKLNEQLYEEKIESIFKKYIVEDKKYFLYKNLYLVYFEHNEGKH